MRRFLEQFCELWLPIIAICGGAAIIGIMDAIRTTVWLYREGHLK